MLNRPHGQGVDPTPIQEHIRHAQGRIDVYSGALPHLDCRGILCFRYHSCSSASKSQHPVEQIQKLIQRKYGQAECMQAKGSIVQYCFTRQRKVWVASGWFNLVSDVTILLVPLRPILCLQIPWTSKIRIAAIFGLGIFACAASAARAHGCMNMLHVTIRDPTLAFDLDMIGIYS